MSFERSYSIESHERMKLILIFGDKSLLLIWWVTYINYNYLDTKIYVYGIISTSLDSKKDLLFNLPPSTVICMLVFTYEEFKIFT